MDFLTKKTKKNEGEIPQYYVRNSHEAIVSPEVYDLVQEEIKKRAQERFNYSCTSFFSSKMVCGECGSFYGAKVWHSNDKYRRVVWQCNRKFKNKEKCRTPHLNEEQIKSSFIKAFNNLVKNKEEVIKDCEDIILSLANTQNLENQITQLQDELDVVVGLTRRLIYENSRKAIDQEEYNKKYNSYTEKYKKIKNELSALEMKKQELKVRKDKMTVFIDNLKNVDGVIQEFDDRLWYMMVEKVIIHENGEKEFQFKNQA